MRTRMAGIAVSVLWSSTAAFADGGGGDVELSAFRPAIDSRGFITVDGADSLESGQLSLGLVSSWARGLLRLDGGGATYAVENVVTPTLIAAYGLPAGLEVGMSLPFGVVSGRRTPIDDNGTPMDPYDDDRRRVAEQGLGDLGLHVKLELGSGGLRGALIGSALLPTASRETWLGTGKTTVSGRGVLEVRRGRLRAAINAGLRTRLGGDAAFHDDPDPMLANPMPTTGADVVVGPAAIGGLAASVAISPKIELVGESFAVIPLRGEGYRPVEALAGAKVYLAERSYLSLGGGVGLGGAGGNPDARVFVGIVFEPKSPARARVEIEDEPVPPPARGEGDRDGDQILDSLDDCPDDPEDPDGFQDGDGCPESDNDGDRIVDAADLCENDAEDMDGVEDDDGCPETDADKDRIADHLDKCKLKPESWNTFEDDDGCPDRSTVNVGISTIEILDEIHFDFDSARIQERSHALLATIAETIELNPDLLEIAIGGHTDERGSDEYNLKLSDARANAVRDHLIGLGIAAERLTAEGYGEREPKMKGHGEKAWRANRRVEFVIVERGA
jgi:outer membrane protein OmpA-like peptidoglycan-associated protein